MAITNAQFKSSQQDLTNWLVIVWWFQPLFICSLWSKLHKLPAMASCDWLSSPFWCSRWHAEIKIGSVMVYVHSFRTTIHPCDGCFQQNKVPCNKAQIKLVGWTFEWVTRSQSNRAPFGIWWSWRVWFKDVQQKSVCRFDKKKKNPERGLLLNI